MGGPIMEEGEQGPIVTFTDFFSDKKKREKESGWPHTPVHTPYRQQTSYTSAPHLLTGITNY